MKKVLLFVLALAVIPVGVDAQVLDLEETRASADQGYALAQNNLGFMYANGAAGRTLWLPTCGLILPQPKGLGQAG